MASSNTLPQSAQFNRPNTTITERDRYKSPPPPVSSMTPPPSSQAPAPLSQRARTVTPPPAHLSSPPPTIKSDHTAPPPYQTNNIHAVGMYSQEQIDDATSDELRMMLNETLASMREARASAAHHNLQYTLLCMESSEAMKRMEVELEMKQKEVEVLQSSRQASSALATPVMSNQGAVRATSPNDRIVLDLKNACQLLEIENENLQRRLSDAKAALIEREDALMEENDRLRDRIRENRSHMAMFRRSNIMPETPSMATMNTPFITPAASAVQLPKQTPARQQVPSTPKQQGDQTFAALLLADRVLSAEEASGTPKSSTHATRSAKTTSRIRNPSPTVPATPAMKRFGPYYMDTPSAQPRLQSPPLAFQTPNAKANQHRRRESRDSTISASDLEEQERHDEDLNLSRLSSQSASKTRSAYSRRNNIIPSTPTKAMVSTKVATPTSSKILPGTAQSDKLKRKLPQDGVSSQNNTRASKRGKLAEGVGLGIGGLSER